MTFIFVSFCTIFPQDNQILSTWRLLYEAFVVVRERKKKQQANLIFRVWLPFFLHGVPSLQK